MGTSNARKGPRCTSGRWETCRRPPRPQGLRQSSIPYRLGRCRRLNPTIRSVDSSGQNRQIDGVGGILPTGLENPHEDNLMFRHRATRLGSLRARLALIRVAGEQGVRGGPRAASQASYRAWWLFLLVTTTARRVTPQ
jgi:hypothetical protein